MCGVNFNGGCGGGLSAVICTSDECAPVCYIIVGKFLAFIDITVEVEGAVACDFGYGVVME